MEVIRRGFLMGLIIGVALAMIAMDMWAFFLTNKLDDSAQPRLLQPFNQLRAAKLAESSEGLPQPWFPETSTHSHGSWQLQQVGGPNVRLADLKGKVIFLNFWSTTCAPCIEEMPGVEHLSDSLKNEAVAFLAVTQEDEKQVRSFLQKHPIAIPVYLANHDVPDDLRTSGLPTTFILDPNGVAVFRHAGPLNWDTESTRTFLRRLVRPKNLPN